MFFYIIERLYYLGNNKKSTGLNSHLSITVQHKHRSIMSNKNRQYILQCKEISTGDIVPMVTTYHPILKDLNNILKKHIPIFFTPIKELMFSNSPIGLPLDTVVRVGKSFTQWSL